MADKEDSFSVWQQELAVCSPQQGFYQKLRDNAVVYIQQPGATRLMVGFDDLTRLGGKEIGRDAWGAKFAIQQGWSFLGVMANQSYWFRDNQLHNFLESLRDRNFFSFHEKTLFSGTSMGAYASLAFADLAPGANVLAFAPQNTLDTSLVPWETRFETGRKMDWSGRYREANDGFKKANKAYVIYDPLEELDKKHVEMLSGDNLHAYQAFGCGHRIALIAKNCFALKDLTLSAMEGELTHERYRELMRMRGGTTFYRQNLVKRMKAKGQSDRAKAFSKICFAMHRELDERRRQLKNAKKELKNE